MVRGFAARVKAGVLILVGSDKWGARDRRPDSESHTVGVD